MCPPGLGGGGSRREVRHGPGRTVECVGERVRFPRRSRYPWNGRGRADRRRLSSRRSWADPDPPRLGWPSGTRYGRRIGPACRDASAHRSAEPLPGAAGRGSRRPHGGARGGPGRPCAAGAYGGIRAVGRMPGPCGRRVRRGIRRAPTTGAYPGPYGGRVRRGWRRPRYGSGAPGLRVRSHPVGSGRTRIPFRSVPVWSGSGCRAPRDAASSMTVGFLPGAVLLGRPPTTGRHDRWGRHQVTGSSRG